VALFSPGFFFYGPIRRAGGVPVYARTTQESGWAWDVDALEAVVGPRTRLLVVNSPTNPTGHVASRQELEAVAALAERRDLIVVADEAYDNMVFDGAEHVSLASLGPAAGRTLTVGSFTKSYAMRAWRMGYVAGPPELVGEAARVLEWDVLQCNHVAQYAALEAATGDQTWREAIAARFERARDAMTEGLRAIPGCSFAAPGGCGFIFLNVAALPVPPSAVRERLLFDHGIATDLGDAFGSELHLRLPFGAPDETVAEAVGRLEAALAGMGAHP
jgi:aspartate/methionine/tyrosine aminotransferase